MLSIGAFFFKFLSMIKMFSKFFFLRHLECSGQLSFPECQLSQPPIEYKVSALLWN